GTLAPSDPTDPEVPAAKRLRAARRRRSLVLAAAAITLLLVALFALLYRMEQQVTAHPLPSENLVKQEERPLEPATSTGLESAGAPALRVDEQELNGSPETNAPPSPRTSATSASPARPAGRSGTDSQGGPKPTSTPQIFRRPTF